LRGVTSAAKTVDNVGLWLVIRDAVSVYPATPTVHIPVPDAETKDSNTTGATSVGDS